MDRGAVLFGATLFLVLAVLTSFASSKAGKPDVDGAVAAALRQHLTDVVGVEAIEGKAGPPGALVLCIESKVPLGIDAVARDLAETIVRPVPDSSCASKTVERDFGMFTALTTYYDARGLEAGHLEIAEVSCSSSRTCVVDIDGVGSGERYIVRRKGGAWSATERRSRWVV